MKGAKEKLKGNPEDLENQFTLKSKKSPYMHLVAPVKKELCLKVRESKNQNYFKVNIIKL